MTQEDHLLELHQEYINQVTESGQPLWMINLYSEQPNTQSYEHQTQHKKDSDQSPEVTDDSDNL
jgi:hypothetical protein